MRILFIAPLHYPAELDRIRAQTPPAAPPPLFPPNMSQHFWVEAFRARGHEVHAFYRSDPALPLPEAILGHRLVRGASQRLPRLNPDYRRRNARLLAVARRIRPDLIWLSGDNEVIYPETLTTIKAETGAALVYVTGTSPIVFSHANERAAARLYDLVVTNDFYHGIQWQELGAPRMVALPYVAVDPAFHRPYDLSADERNAYGCEVGFVGTLVPENLYSRRVTALAALREFDLGIWSVHPAPESLRPFYRGAALGQEMLRVLSGAQIALNVHGDFMRYGGNMRLFELAAVGVFQIVDDLPGVREWFTPGAHLVTFSDLPDLREKVAYYLAHPDKRAQIAAAARAHVTAEHTYDRRADELLRLVDAMRG